MGKGLLAVTIFAVPITGSFATLVLAALIYVVCATGVGLLVSAFTGSQIAAVYVTMIGTIVPCTQLSGMTDPVSHSQRAGRFHPGVPAPRAQDMARVGRCVPRCCR